MSADSAPLLDAVRRSQDHLAGIVAGLEPGDLTGPSACREWTVAQVLSHLGSQAEIFELLLDAGLSGGEGPSGEVFGPIWDSWNTKTPTAQARDSVAANEALVQRLEALDADALAAFSLPMWGRTLDASDLLRMRLSEHAVHTWDVAVARDQAALVEPYAVDLLLDGLVDTASRTGKPLADGPVIAVSTRVPERRWTLATDAVRLQPEPLDSLPSDGPRIELPAEALLRLVYGRLDEMHPAGGPVDAAGIDVDRLRDVFPGY